MAPWPDETSLYERPSVQTEAVSWKDGASQAAFETASRDDVTATPTSRDQALMSSYINCRGFPYRLLFLLKEPWRNPRYFRWVMCIVVSLVFAVILGFFNSFGPLYMCLRRDLHSTAVETGSVASLGWSIGILSPFVNVLYQRFGPRKIAITATLLCSVGLLASSFVTSIWPMFVTFGLIFGVGIHFLITGSVTMIASHFDSHECALPTALPGIGGSIGMLIYSPVVELAYERFGWRASIRFVAALVLVAGLVGAVWQKRPASQKRRPQGNHDDSDSDAVTASTGSSDPDAVKVRKMGMLQEKQEKAQLVRERRRKSKENYIYLAKDPIHWMFCVATMLCNIVMIFNIINLVELMTSVGYSAQKSAMFMSILSFCEIGFRLLTGIFGDRLPCTRVLTLPVICLLCACTTFSLTISTSAGLIIAYVCFAGLGRAVNYSIIYAASIETFGHAVHQESFSILQAAYGVACFPGAIIPGLSFDLTGSYQSSNYCGTVMWLISAALYMGVYLLKNRKNRLAYEAVLLRDSTITPGDIGVGLPAEAPVLTGVYDSADTTYAQDINRTVVHDGISEKSVDVEGALEALMTPDFDETAHVAEQKFVVIVDKISTV